MVRFVMDKFRVRGGFAFLYCLPVNPAVVLDVRVRPDSACSSTTVFACCVFLDECLHWVGDVWKQSRLSCGSG